MIHEYLMGERQSMTDLLPNGIRTKHIGLCMGNHSAIWSRGSKHVGSHLPPYWQPLVYQRIRLLPRR
jgi:hypothetical protein